MLCRTNQKKILRRDISEIYNVALDGPAGSGKSTVAKALAKEFDVTLIYCFELPGVMRDPEDESSLIKEITHESYRTLLDEGIVSGGMIPKMDNAFNAIDNGVAKVIITKADAIDGVQGTHITA